MASFDFKQNSSEAIIFIYETIKFPQSWIFCRRKRKCVIYCLMVYSKHCYVITTDMLEESDMRISYNKLWKLLIDKNMKKQDLKKATGISATCIAKIGRGDNVTTDVLVRICTALDCKLEDIMELVPDDTLQSTK